MSDDKKSLIDLITDIFDKTTKSSFNKSALNIGTTFADIWFLVFGSVSYATEKQRLKYSYALQEFQKELEKKHLKSQMIRLCNQTFKLQNRYFLIKLRIITPSYLMTMRIEYDII